MSTPLEWYAADSGWYGQPCYAPTPVLYSPLPNQAIYGRVVGIPGAVVWTTIWEPLSGGWPPTIYQGGPLGAGQVPIAMADAGSPATYSPSDPNAVAAILFFDYGILRLKAVVDGIPIPGELVMTISSGGGYADIALEYQAGGPGPGPALFWARHQATYEIP